MHIMHIRSTARLQTAAAILAAALILAGVFAISQLDSKASSRPSAVGGRAAASSEQAVAVTLVRSGKTEWQYRDSGSVPPLDAVRQDWRLPGYDAADWKTGIGSFGSVKGQRTDAVNKRFPVNLPNQYTPDGKTMPVHYFRTEFLLEQVGEERLFECSIRFDDAIVIYLNGVQIYSNNVPDDGYGAKSTVDSSRLESFTVTELSALRKGANVIMVELHQASSSSSDFYFDFIELEFLNAKAVRERVEAANIMLELGSGSSSDSMRVNWITSGKSSYTLQYANQELQRGMQTYQSSDMVQSAESVGGIYRYTALMKGLAPGAKYAYRVADAANASVTNECYFEMPASSSPFSFLFFGDPQIGARKLEDDAFGWENTLAAALSLSPRPSFAIAAGDLTDSSDEADALDEYFAFRSPKALKELPLVTVKGNHDGSLYDLQFDHDRLSAEGNDFFRYGSALFVELNTNNDDYEKQRRYLEAAIKKNPAEWVVVLMHYSTFSAGPHMKEEKILRCREEYAESFSGLDVDLVLSGPRSFHKCNFAQ